MRGAAIETQADFGHKVVLCSRMDAQEARVLNWWDLNGTNFIPVHPELSELVACERLMLALISI